jgi:hypothetical protein
MMMNEVMNVKDADEHVLVRKWSGYSIDVDEDSKTRESYDDETPMKVERWNYIGAGGQKDPPVYQ